MHSTIYVKEYLPEMKSFEYIKLYRKRLVQFSWIRHLGFLTQAQSMSASIDTSASTNIMILAYWPMYCICKFVWHISLLICLSTYVPHEYGMHSRTDWLKDYFLSFTYLPSYHYDAAHIVTTDLM